MLGAEYQKKIYIDLFTKGYLCLLKMFCFGSITYRLFHLVFTKNILENCLENFIGGAYAI